MNKDKSISFKIEKLAKAEYKQICEDNFTDVSAELYKFVHQQIKLSKAKKISLTQYSKRIRHED